MENASVLGPPPRSQHVILTQIHSVSWTETFLILILACVAAGTAYLRASALDPVIYIARTESGYYPADMWFDGDVPKNVTMMRDRHSEQHNITSEHPLISLATYPPVFFLQKLGGLALFEAIRVYWAVLAALWTASLFILFRLTGCRRLDATIFAVVGMTSAAALFWFAVPEAFSVGSVTIVWALCLAAAAGRSKSSFLLYGLTNLVSLSVTLTNWMLGIFAAFLNLPWRRALAAMAGALLIASLLWGVEKALFPNAVYFLTGNRSRLSESLYYPAPERVVQVVRAFFSHTMVMPQIGVEDEYEPGRPRMTVQQSSAGSGSTVGYGATVAWIALFTLGLWACASACRTEKMVQLVGLTTAGQLGLHVLFGGQTFLYCMHFVPLLLMIASRVTQTRLRVAGLVLAGIVAAGALINNQQQFLKAVEFVRYISQLAAAYHP